MTNFADTDIASLAAFIETEAGVLNKLGEDETEGLISDREWRLKSRIAHYEIDSTVSVLTDLPAENLRDAALLLILAHDRATWAAHDDFNGVEQAGIAMQLIRGAIDVVAEAGGLDPYAFANGWFLDKPCDEAAEAAA